MTILKATLLTRVNSTLNRDETDIDNIIADLLDELTVDFPALLKDTSFALTLGQAAYASGDTGFPTDFRDIETIRIYDSSDSKYGPPLKRIRSWRAYLDLIQEQNTSDYSEPIKFIVHHKKVYVWPTPDAAIYTAYLDYSAFENDPDSIQLGDEWQGCLINGTLFKYLESKGMATSQNGVLHGGLYRERRDALIGLQRNREGPKSIPYNDI